MYSEDIWKAVLISGGCYFEHLAALCLVQLFALHDKSDVLLQQQLCQGQKTQMFQHQFSIAQIDSNSSAHPPDFHAKVKLNWTDLKNAC